MLPESAQPISVDDHLVEPAHLWVDRLPVKFAESMPRIVSIGDEEAWEYAGKRYVTSGTLAAAGRDSEELTHGPITFASMRPGCYDPKARLSDLDEAGIYGSLAFPTFSRFAGHRFLEGNDRELALLCVRAYNDFMIDEWCATDPSRLIPLAILPLWDVEQCIREISRVASRGARAVAFSENPTGLGLPSIHTGHWDGVFRAISESDMALCLHIGSSSEVITSSPDAPYGVHVSLVGLGSMIAFADFVFSHVLQLNPDLRIVLSEGGAGWVPYMLERTDWTFERHRYHANIRRDAKPSEIFAKNFWVCIIADQVALHMRSTIGVDRMMWESDYPHSDSLWPHSRKHLDEALLDIPSNDAIAIAEGNAKNVFRL